MTHAAMIPTLSNHFPETAASSMYAQARQRAQRGQIWSSLGKRPRCLLTLSKVRSECTVLSKTHSGIRSVPINQIRGSEGRSSYFDRDFMPLHEHARGRWLGIAKARQQGKELPPVVLVRVGDIYFVRDGHHRISVARAMGQKDIEARVTVWQVDGPLDFELSRKTLKDTVTGRFVAARRALSALQRQVTKPPEPAAGHPVAAAR